MKANTEDLDGVEEHNHIGGKCSTDSTLNLKVVWQKGVGVVYDLALLGGQLWGLCCGSQCWSCCHIEEDICSTAPWCAAHGPPKAGLHLPHGVLKQLHAAIHVGRPVYRHVTVSQDRHQFATVLGR